MRAPRGLSRRDLLRGGLGAALGTAAGCRPARAAGIEGRIVDADHAAGHRFRDGTARAGGGSSRERRARVLVVGGGVAGLAAAWRLARAGIDGVTVLELGSEPGGTSRGGAMGGLAHPWGAHYLPVPRIEQRALVAFLEDAGIGAGADAAGRLVVPTELLVRAPQERLYTLGWWDEGVSPVAGASARDAAEAARFDELVGSVIALDPSGRRLFDLPLERSSPAMRALDGISAAAWAASNGLDGERIRWSLEYATRDDFGARLEDTSAWALLHYFAARADLGAKESAEYLAWPEGNAFLVRRLAALAQLAGTEVLSGQLALAALPEATGARIDVVDVATGEPTSWRADRVVLATPQFITRRLLASDPAEGARARFRYGPWVVANLHLDEVPASRGFPLAWDNVLYHSQSLGYVDASHQVDRAGRDTVWTWYLPITDADERTARAEMLAARWEGWRDLVLADLAGPHPDIAERVTRLDVWRWGHAMVKPVPGFLFGGARKAAMQAVGRVHFAHSDLSGVALFEEAHWQGTRAAEEVLAALGHEVDSLL